MENGKKSRRMALLFGAVVLAMFSLGFAIAPLYSLYCKLTGTQSVSNTRSTGESLVKADGAGAVNRLVTVKFDANVSSGLPWEFKPLVRKLEVRLGETVEAKFIAHNLAQETIVGQAIPNVVPWQATEYFNKTECFCFSEQALQAGESKEMVVIFLVSPNLPDGINSLTLSYTFMNRDAQSAKKFEQVSAHHGKESVVQPDSAVTTGQSS
ncbi:MAG TPA: cytochrome c oxidase assembly protein [Burkholderiales bacterium]|nr:cytochrome c oxidase assembly protein [Burkholderiales bacterium]